MSKSVYNPAGGLVESWDDVTRTYTNFVTSETRPYTAAENTEADLIQAAVTVGAAREANRTAVKAIINDLQAEKARVQPIIDKDNALLKLADLKDVARASKRIADAAIELARFVQDI